MFDSRSVFVVGLFIIILSGSFYVKIGTAEDLKCQKQVEDCSSEEIFSIGTSSGKTLLDQSLLKGSSLKSSSSEDNLTARTSDETYETNESVCVEHNVTSFAPKPLGKVKCILVPMTFTVEVIGKLGKSEYVGILGDYPELGSWKLAHSIPLIQKKWNIQSKTSRVKCKPAEEESENNTTSAMLSDHFDADSVQNTTKKPIKTLWKVIIRLCKGIVVCYRYFIYTVDLHGRKTIRQWESSMMPRSIRVCRDRCNRIDKLGLMNGEKRINRGWLSYETIVQFKLDSPTHLRLHSKEDQDAFLDAGILVKIVPFDLETNMPLDESFAKVEISKMVYGDSILKSQNEDGVNWKFDDFIIIHVTVLFFHSTVYDIFLHTMDYKPIGFVRVIPADLLHSTGFLHLNVMSLDELRKTGFFVIPYLVIECTDFANEYDMRTSFEHTWLGIWKKLDIGHRGMGKSFTSNPAPFIENTIESFNAINALHGDGIELDVHLTADCIPIVFHDFSFLTTRSYMEPKSEHDLVRVFIKDVTYEELCHYNVYFIIDNKIVKYPSRYAEPDPNKRIFPTLVEVFAVVPVSIGIVIDVKYPQALKSHSLEYEQTIDKNKYVSTIIYVTLFHGCQHPVMFISVDPDITTMFRFKQNRFPVAFSIKGRSSVYGDRRTHSTIEALNHAQAFGLIGIGLNAEILLADPSIVTVVNKFGMEVYVWGDAINSRERVKYIKSLDVSLVIYDRMDLYGPKNKGLSILQCKSSLSLFHSQCLYPNSTKNNEKS